MDVQDIMNIKKETSELENSPMGLHVNINIKQEPVSVSEEHTPETMKLYADHEIKEEIVIGPVVLQLPNVDDARCAQSTSDNLNIHTQPYKCNICNIGFMSSHVHMCRKVTCTGEKRFKCEHCNKSFIQKSNLNRHLMIHTGEKPYKCEHCNKCFTQKQVLKTHLMIHTEEKPYKCEHCNKSFFRKSDLNRHLISRTGGKPYKCEHCNKSFFRKLDLKKHLITHIGEKL
ncbi:zinc finger protein 254-like [Hyposmocoma kahamanoa]|uniref:zinc finger protein 254-like n=1 Tax=Hyposmocoma kahamanoa TaxID=1477025 RepID=UPI000E6D6D47|nr:zinc finger protein 254-like [Hyposmocoma kahamanoa]